MIDKNNNILVWYLIFYIEVINIKFYFYGVIY